MTKFDWYQATIHDADIYRVLLKVAPDLGCSEFEAISFLDGRDVSFSGPARLVPCKAKNGYLRGLRFEQNVSASKPAPIAELWFDGNSGIHGVATGSASPSALSDAFKTHFPEHNVTRADVCIDWLEEGLFDRMASNLQAFAIDNNISLSNQGDWVRGQGRTLYVGSRKSTTMLRLYEKGYLVPGGDRTWVRLEAVVRPAKKAKQKVAFWEASKFWGASRWLSKAMAQLGSLNIEVDPVGTVRTNPDALRAKYALIRQYSNTMRSWADEVGGWDSLANVLAEACEASKSGEPADIFALLSPPPVRSSDQVAAESGPALAGRLEPALT